MKQGDIFHEDFFDEPDLAIDKEVGIYLIDTAKWTKFIAITIFICLAIVLIIAATSSYIFPFIFSKAFDSFGFSSVNGTILIVWSVVVFAAICTLAVSLINFGSKIRSGLETENNEAVNKGLNWLKIFFLVSVIIKILGLFWSIKTVFMLFN